MKMKKKKWLLAATANLFLLLAVLALPLPAHAAKRVTTLTIKKGQSYDIYMNKKDGIDPRIINLKVLKKKTSYDYVFYSGMPGSGSDMGLGVTKSEKLYAQSIGSGLPKLPCKELDDPDKILLGSIKVNSGSVRIQVTGYENAKQKLEPVKVKHAPFKTYTLKKGKSKSLVLYENKNFACPHMELIFKAKKGTTLKFTGKDWSQTLKYNSKNIAVTNKESGQSYKDTWTYLKKSGSYRYNYYINIKETGKIKANNTITVYIPYMYNVKAR